MKTQYLTSRLAWVALAVGLLWELVPGGRAAPEKVAYLGVIVSAVDQTLREQVKLPGGVGLSVMEVVPDSPAAKCGIKVHDVLEKLDDQLLCNGDQLSALVRGREPWSTATITLIRHGKRETVEVKLGEIEAEPASPLPFEDIGQHFRDIGRALKESPDFRRLRDWFGFGVPGQVHPSTFFGVQLGPIEPALAAQLGLEEGTGALVNMVVEGSPADKAGIRRHDVIVKIDGETVNGPGHFVKQIAARKKGDKIKLEVFRGGKKVEVEAVLTEKSSPWSEQRWLRDTPKSIKDLEYRLVPRLHVYNARPEERQADEIVIELEEVEDGDGRSGRNRSEMRSGGTREHDLKHSVTTRVVNGPEQPIPGHRLRVVVVRTENDVTTVREEDGERFVTVKDLNGNVVFDGKVNSDADKVKLPRQVRECLERIERGIRTKEKDGLFEDNLRELRVPVPPAPSGAI